MIKCVFNHKRLFSVLFLVLLSDEPFAPLLCLCFMRRGFNFSRDISRNRFSIT